MSFENICKLNDILPNGGRCALIDGKQVAIFRISKDGNDQLFAVSNYDPFSNANVLSRGLVGSSGDKLVIIAPIYKQRFDLATGQCLEDENVCLETWDVKLEGDAILVSSKESVAA